MIRKAFTMIELIFVIVIIGLLSAVAIPKLVASRDDATATICITTAQKFLHEVAVYYTVHGDFSNISKMSNIRIDNADTGFANDIDMNNNTAQFYCENEALLQYVTSKNATAVTLIVSSLSPSNSPAAFIADTTLINNSFYKTYFLGGYTN